MEHTVAAERLGPYLIDEHEIGEGPVRSCRARRLLASGLTRPCRLRRLDLRHVGGQDERLRLLDEARLVIGLQHPGIVALQDYGVFEDELVLEEELLRCANLRAILRGDGALTTGEALVVACELAGVLAHVHGVEDDAGRPLDLVHRNLVPEHVQLTTHGEVKLGGFAMARFRGRLARTAHGSPRDRLGYTTPEEVHGWPMDHRGDLFGLGLLLVEMLTGRAPPALNEPGRLREVMTPGRWRVRELLGGGVHEEVVEAIVGLTQLDPDDRLAGAREAWLRLWDLRKVAGSPRDEDRLAVRVRRMAESS